MTKQMSPFARMDGHYGVGGCKLCDARVKIDIDGSGVTHFTIQHDHDCPVIADGPHSEAVIGAMEDVESLLAPIIQPNREQRRQMAREERKRK